MTIGNLWLPVLGAPIPTFPIVAAGTFGGFVVSNPLTVPLPSGYTTVPGDCIIVAYSASNIHTPSFSGGGVTWDNHPEDTNQTSGLAIGWGAAGGDSSFSFTYFNNTIPMVFAIGVFRNVRSGSDPLVSFQQATSGGSLVSTLVTPALSYSPAQLLVASSSTQNFASSVVPVIAWGNGEANTNIASGDSGGGGGFFEVASLDQGQSLIGNSSTATAATSTAVKMRITIANLAHA